MTESHTADRLDIPAAYHSWYYDSLAWRTTSWFGVPVLKSVCDMWNYQEILAWLRPSMVVEFGTAWGGSALYFATVLQQVRERYAVLTVDVDRERVDQRVLDHRHIEVVTARSTDDVVRDRIRELRARHPGPVFAILDSDHSEANVTAELALLETVLVAGDYVVVEDTNLNGHPVLPEYGPGPYEAVQRFLAEHPNSFRRDVRREEKFGFTFAPSGFLVRLA